MIQNEEYLEGLQIGGNLFVRSCADKKNSPYYTYWFKDTSVCIRGVRRVRVYNVRLNFKDSGIDNSFLYAVTITDTCGKGSGLVGAKQMSYGHYKYGKGLYGDRVVGSIEEISFEEWRKEGSTYA